MDDCSRKNGAKKDDVCVWVCVGVCECARVCECVSGLCRESVMQWECCAVRVREGKSVHVVQLVCVAPVCVWYL